MRRRFETKKKREEDPRFVCGKMLGKTRVGRDYDIIMILFETCQNLVIFQQMFFFQVCKFFLFINLGSYFKVIWFCISYVFIIFGKFKKSFKKNF